MKDNRVAGIAAVVAVLLALFGLAAVFLAIWMPSWQWGVTAAVLLLLIIPAAFIVDEFGS